MLTLMKPKVKPRILGLNLGRNVAGPESPSLDSPPPPTHTPAGWGGGGLSAAPLSTAVLRAWIGCAFFADLLKAAFILCKTLQEVELCIVRPIKALGKAKRGFDKVRATTHEELPMVRKVIAHVSNPDDPASSVFPWLASPCLRSHITCLQRKIKCQQKRIVRGLCP